MLGLHEKAKQVQPRGCMAGNKRVMSRKRLALEQQQQLIQAKHPDAIECVAREQKVITRQLHFYRAASVHTFLYLVA